MAQCERCRNMGGYNNGKCSCVCHLDFAEKVAYLLNQNTDGD